MKYGITIIVLLLCLFIDGFSQADFKAYTQEISGTDVSFRMTPIKGGDFVIGAAEKDKKHEADEIPRTRVEVSSFWMGIYEVTQKEYLLFTDAKNDLLADGQPNQELISRPSSPYEDPSKGLGDDDAKPAVGLTQYAALSYCRWLYRRTGIFYRIPTEAEWEYAAKGGSDTPYFFEKKKDLKKYAWYAKNADNQLHRVGLKEPNQNGLYDIYGNVAEWCLDQYYSDLYTKIEDGQKDPRGMPNALYPRSVRGCSFMDDVIDCRSSNRMTSLDAWKARDPQLPKSFWWNTDSEFVGFRLVRPLLQPSQEEVELFFATMLE